MFDYLVVGAGFAGSVIAERLASQLDKRVLVVDKRSHIAGNAFDFYNDEGILIHKYGPHIFHTNSKRIYDYLSQFTEWRLYEHRVLSSVDGQLLPVPINATTINRFFGTSLCYDEIERFLIERRELVEHIRNSRDVIVSQVGLELYEKFFRGYTKKQWDLYPEELDASVTSRIPVRFNADDRYFTDIYQVMPLQGYTRMFERMLAHENISVLLQCDYRDVVSQLKFNELIFTGPIDDYFDHCFGKLPYRSLEFEFETLDSKQVQSVGTINFPNQYDFTRITEFKHLTGQRHEKTTLVKEYPKSDGEPYYPIPRPENSELYAFYKREAEKYAKVHFIGRLGTYKYYNMDQVVGQSLSLFDKLSKRDTNG